MFEWQHITFENGSNPYICTTEKEFTRMQNKYSLKYLKHGFWLATERDDNVE